MALRVHQAEEVYLSDSSNCVTLMGMSIALTVEGQIPWRSERVCSYKLQSVMPEYSNHFSFSGAIDEVLSLVGEILDN